jgi:hypothetical protein
VASFLTCSVSMFHQLPRGYTFARIAGVGVVLVAAFQSTWALAAQDAAPVPLVQRARGATQIVVGRVTAVNPVWQVNEFGDRLIVSVVRVAVDETLKGIPAGSVDVEIEGGTIAGTTLHVSDQESFVPGDRAVFYLTRSGRGALVPHLRGQGTLKLDRASRVPNSSLTLDEIRRTVATAREQR